MAMILFGLFCMANPRYFIKNDFWDKDIAISTCGTLGYTIIDIASKKIELVTTLMELTPAQK